MKNYIDFNLINLTTRAVSIKFLKNIINAMMIFPNAPWGDAFSEGQLRSKFWLIEELSQVQPECLGTVFVLGGWLGLLPALLSEKYRLSCKGIHSIDNDRSVHGPAVALSRNSISNGMQFSARTEDIYEISYNESDTIVNTICEHLGDFPRWYKLVPKGKLLVLQSNNFSSCEEHLNCHETLAEFIGSAPMSRLVYSGELSMGQYKRWMLIGYK